MTHILKADHLSEETRSGDCKRVVLISSAAGKKPLIQVLALHPTKVLDWMAQSYTEVGTQRTMIVATLAVYKLFDLKRKERTSYDLFLEQYKLDAVLRAKDNVQTDRQRAGFVSYLELQQVRKRLLDRLQDTRSYESKLVLGQ